MTVKERLVIFAKSKEKSVRAFESKIGLTIGYVNAIRVSIQPDKIQSIVSYYPDLNAGWLMTGEGEMLKNAADTTISNDLVSENEALKRELDLCKGENSKLKDRIIELQDIVIRLTDSEKGKSSGLKMCNGA